MCVIYWNQKDNARKSLLSYRLQQRYSIKFYEGRNFYDWCPRAGCFWNQCCNLSHYGMQTACRIPVFKLPLMPFVICSNITFMTKICELLCLVHRLSESLHFYTPSFHSCLKRLLRKLIWILPLKLVLTFLEFFVRILYTWCFYFSKYLSSLQDATQTLRSCRTGLILSKAWNFHSDSQGWSYIQNSINLCKVNGFHERKLSNWKISENSVKIRSYS